MRIPLANLLVRGPLPRIGDLMDAVVACTDKVPGLIDLLIAGDQEAVAKLAKEISVLEGQADDAKNKVRSKMPARLFMPVDRRDVLKLVSDIDAIADCAEDVGVLLTLRALEVPSEMKPVLKLFIESVTSTVGEAAKLVEMLDNLMGAGFGGRVAAQAIEQAAILGHAEHEADKLQDQCAKILFREEGNMPPVAIFMWTKLLNKLGDIANHAENVGTQFRLFVAG